jgi:hypothetical protein
MEPVAAQDESHAGGQAERPDEVQLEGGVEPEATRQDPTARPTGATGTTREPDFSSERRQVVIASHALDMIFVGAIGAGVTSVRCMDATRCLVDQHHYKCREQRADGCLLRSKFANTSLSLRSGLAEGIARSQT